MVFFREIIIPDFDVEKSALLKMILVISLIYFFCILFGWIKYCRQAPPKKKKKKNKKKKKDKKKEKIEINIPQDEEDNEEDKEPSLLEDKENESNKQRKFRDLEQWLDHKQQSPKQQ